MQFLLPDPLNFYSLPYNFHGPARSIRHPPYKRKSRHIALAYGQHIPINFGACPTTSAPAYRNDTRHVNHPHPDLSSERRRVRPSLIREVTASATALFNSLSIFRHKMPITNTQAPYLSPARVPSYWHPTFHRHESFFTGTLPFTGRSPITGTPSNITAPDLRDDGTCVPSFIYKTRFVRCGCRHKLAAATSLPQAPRRKWGHPRNPASCREYLHRVGVPLCGNPDRSCTALFARCSTSWLWSRPG